MSASSASCRTRRLVLVSCIILWLCAFVATHLPADRLPVIRVGDKSMHFVGYFVLTFMFAMTLFVHGVGRWRGFITAIVVMTVYGAFDEVTQPWFNRYADFADWLIDLAGMATAVAVWEVTMMLRIKRARSKTI